jgi:DNA-binding XRE family transcriptional regulator
MNRCGPRLDEFLIDQGLSPEQFGEKLGLSGRTIYRAGEGKPLSRWTMNRLARELNEDLDTIFPPMPRKRIPGSSRKVAA